jgi:hypothetical protein
MSKFMKRKLSPQQYADELERHLLGNEDKWDWDDTTSIAIADERLERIRRGLSKFDLLTRGKDRDELKAIIAAPALQCAIEPAIVLLHCREPKPSPLLHKHHL